MLALIRWEGDGCESAGRDLLSSWVHIHTVLSGAVLLAAGSCVGHTCCLELQPVGI